MECIIMGGSGAMYIIGKHPDGMNDQEADRRLVKEYGVAVIQRSYCGFPGACLLKETASVPTLSSLMTLFWSFLLIGWIRVCNSNLPLEKCSCSLKSCRWHALEICAASMTLHACL
jgi:hypothetical protein